MSPLQQVLNYNRIPLVQKFTNRLGNHGKFSSKLYQVIPMQGRHSRFLAGKNAIVAATSLVLHSCCRRFLFFKIHPRTRQPWNRDDLVLNSTNAIVGASFLKSTTRWHRMKNLINPRERYMTERWGLRIKTIMQHAHSEILSTNCGWHRARCANLKVV